MVSSRSKTAAEAAANRRTTRSASGAAGGLKAIDVADLNENKPEKKTAKTSSSKATPGKPVSKQVSKPVSESTTSTTAKAGALRKMDRTYCVCKGSDDGTPMIKCEGGCENWYHFRCVNLPDDVAGEIERYYCSDCESKTGLKTVSKLDFEGLDAFDEAKLTLKRGRRITPAEELEEVESIEESEDDNTADEYVADPKGKTRSGKRISRRLSFSSDRSESDDDSVGKHHKRTGGRLKRIKKASSSPQPGMGGLKRRSSSAQQPATKRSKTSEDTYAQNDAIRRYCLAKLEEIIQPMFEEYRNQQTTLEGQKIGEGGEENQVDASNKSTGSEKQSTDASASAFVSKLEQCMMDIYAEPDKSGKPSAAGKYKERFRMLQFNLPKPDRVVLRKGIASGRITPAQLNVMSSTDLADEQTKHEIEAAEKEALEHSILQKVSAPRAKITHKGFEAIEDVSGQRTVDVAKEEEEQRIEMEMEKREREKLARLRMVSHAEGSPTTPVEPSPLSVGLPNSPTVTNTTRPQHWGAPPPLPMHVLQNQSELASTGSPLSSRPPVRPLFVPSASDYTSSGEEGLSLADLINIDDDLPTQEMPQSNPQQRMSEQFNAESGSGITPVIITPSGPSPFAPSSSKATESPRRTSFNLNSLWTGLDKNDTPNEPEATQDDQEIPLAKNSIVDNQEENQDDAMDLESVEDYDDRALDAILEGGNGNQKGSAGPSLIASPDIDTLPQVWSGEICMPVDNLSSLAPFVICKQIGGRTFEPLSGYWQTLFPSPQARIDGRVPVNTSAQYLVSTRLNPVKELIAVCFTPFSEEDTRFNELIDYLVGKDRHALVFPWGVHPKPTAPGRELYIIPLLQTSPIPEYIELLDDVRLPKDRKSNILLGVFVLNKGKLVASTPPPPPPPISSSHTTPSGSTHLLSTPTAPLMIPASSVPVPSPPVKIDQAALAAEVASLTPEQISLMLRHLSQNAPLPTPVSGSMPPIIPPIGPPSAGFPVPLAPHLPPQFPQTYQQHMQPPSQHFSPPSQGGFGRPGYDGHDDYQRQPYGREGHGGRVGRGRGNDRGRRGGRGRGKPYTDDRDARQHDLDHKPADQGWSGRGRGGGASGNSPQERRSRFAN
ncbi:hypothetical protein DFH11DRAFT_1691587 [Phellopilus nigrolimitatus]|nr:hypothetical protein DFH11DRAFT_1691587 [Phellopilus nigrolimitatus]